MQRRAEVDTFIGKQPVQLLEGMLGHQAVRQRKSLANRVDRQGGGPDDGEGGVGQGLYPPGVHVAVEQAGQAAVYFHESEGLVRSHRLPRASCCTRGNLPIAGLMQPICGR